MEMRLEYGRERRKKVMGEDVRSEYGENREDGGGRPVEDSLPADGSGTGAETPERTPGITPMFGERFSDRSTGRWLKPVALAALTLAIAGASFFCGMKLGESRGRSPQEGAANWLEAETGNSGETGPGMPGSPMEAGPIGIVGEVTTISATQITVKDARSGSTKTFSLTAATEIIRGESGAEVSDIEVGNEVMVVSEGPDSDEAARILIDPGMRGPGERADGISGATPST